MLTRKKTKSNILIVTEHLYVRSTGTPTLTTYKGEAIAGSRRDAYHIREHKACIQKTIQDTASEDTTHTTALQNKAHFATIQHIQYIFWHKDTHFSKYYC